MINIINILPRSMNANAISLGCSAVSATNWFRVTCTLPRIPRKEKLTVLRREIVPTKAHLKKNISELSNLIFILLLCRDQGRNSMNWK